MPKKNMGLLAKLTLTYVLLLAVISAMPFIVTYTTTREALKEQVRDELRSTASALATQIDGGALARLAPGDEGKAEYREIHRRLRAAQEANDHIKYVYTMRRTEGGVEFAVDADYGVQDDGAAIGQPYEEGPQLKELMEGFVRPSADRQFTSDQWGVVLSGYAPVRDSTGNPTGLVGMDMESREVKARLNSIIFRNFFLVLIVVVLGSSVVMTASYLLVVRDLGRILEAVSGDGPVPELRRSDELGILAERIFRMRQERQKPGEGGNGE